jgi:hypothetical protein
MPKALARVGSFIWAHLGHCSLCTRKAFLTAVSAWAASAILAFGADWPHALTFAEAIAAGLTGLWIAHLLAFAGKASGRARNIRPELADPSRRAFLPVFAKTLAFAVVASTVPRLAFATVSPGDDRVAPRWTPMGEGIDAMPLRTARRCFARTYNCGSCCRDGAPGVLFIRDDCVVGCAVGCTGDPCG